MWVLSALSCVDVLKVKPQGKEKTLRVLIPPSAANVALIDANVSALIGGMGASWWREQVRLGRAPQPVVQRPRCTRWRMAEVLEFWRDFGRDEGRQDSGHVTDLEHMQ